MTDAVIIREGQRIPVVARGAGLMGPQGLPGDVAKSASRSALAGEATAAGLSRFLAESGREGLFLFDASNLSAQVTADTAQGIYVPPSSAPTGASGAWVRKFSGPLDARWFGLSASGTGAANKTALDAAIAHHISSGIPLEIPAGTYNHTGALTIEGNYCNVYGASWGKTILKPTSATECIILKSRYGRLARIGVDGSVAGTYGIVARDCTQSVIEDCDARNFDNDGLLIDLGYGGGSAGNNNQLKIRGGSYNSNGGCGVKMIHGLDNNDVQFLGVDASGNTSHGFLLRGHGGYVDPGCLAEGNGGYGIQIAEDADVVDVTGWEINQAYVEANTSGGIRGSDASQNNLIRLKNISGTQGYSGHAGSANTVSSVAGGGLLRFGSNDGTVFSQASGSATAGTAFLGAVHASGGNADLTLVGAGTGTVVALGQTAHAAGTGFLTAHLRVEANNATVGNNATLALQHGTNGANGGGVYLQSEMAAGALGNFVVRVRGAGSMTERLRINNDGASTLTGALTVTGALAASNLSGTNTGDQTSIVGIAGTLAQFNTAITDANLIPEAGGTFTGAVLSSSATAGVGYATGAGGAVTQTTNRTTGVTLNKVCGAITLVSAAGSTAWQSFTVTNSAVAATDVVRVVQKSGTDLYMIHVTAVGAGSFRISFATTGGTTTEQPVFNFAVVKAVAA